MSKNTFRLTFLFIIIALLSSIVILQNFFRSSFNRNSQQAFKTIKRQDINEVIIRGDKNETTIFKDKGKWILRKNGIEYVSDQERIEGIIHIIVNLQKGEIASNNKNKHIELGIGGRNIILKSPKETDTLYIGNVSGVNNNYARIGNSNEVFIASGLSDVFTPDDYRDLSVGFIDHENKVNQIEIIFDNQQLDLVNKNNDWYNGDIKLKKDRVDFFLNDLKTLKSSDIMINDPTLNAFFPKSLTITVKENDKNKMATFYKKDTDYILKTSISSSIFQIPEGYVSSLKKTEKDFTE